MSAKPERTTYFVPGESGFHCLCGVESFVLLQTKASLKMTVACQVRAPPNTKGSDSSRRERLDKAASRETCAPHRIRRRIRNRHAFAGKRWPPPRKRRRR